MDARIRDWRELSGTTRDNLMHARACMSVARIARSAGKQDISDAAMSQALRCVCDAMAAHDAHSARAVDLAALWLGAGDATDAGDER